jgi:hypothetical protein
MTTAGAAERFRPLRLRQAAAFRPPCALHVVFSVVASRIYDASTCGVNPGFGEQYLEPNPILVVCDFRLFLVPLVSGSSDGLLFDGYRALEDDRRTTVQCSASDT